MHVARSLYRWAQRCGAVACVTSTNASGATAPLKLRPLSWHVEQKNYCDHEGWTVLHHASRLGYPEVVAHLVDEGADVNVKDLKHGFTPLMVGATHGHGDVCTLLLAQGANKGDRNAKGSTALDCALRWGHVHVATVLR